MLIIENVGELFLPAAAGAPVRNDCEIRSLRGAYVCIEGGIIVDFGVGSSPSGGSDTIDAGGGLVIPGLIDSHTHLVFAGTREDEFAMRCAGKSYLEIAKAGGGIQRTVAAVRAASLDELVGARAPAAWPDAVLRRHDGGGEKRLWAQR